MTYAKLKAALDRLSDEQLQMSVTIADKFNGELFGVHNCLYINHDPEDDIIDVHQPYLMALGS